MKLIDMVAGLVSGGLMLFLCWFGGIDLRERGPGAGFCLFLALAIAALSIGISIRLREEKRNKQ